MSEMARDTPLAAAGVRRPMSSALGAYSTARHGGADGDQGSQGPADRACGCTGWSIGAGWMRTGDGGGIDSDETAGVEEGDDVLMRTVWPGGWWI